MKFFSVVTVFVLGLLALANAVPLSPDSNVYCTQCNVDNRKMGPPPTQIRMNNMFIQG